MKLDLFIVDAFASRPFSGNPAAVALLEAPADADWMARLAEEMHLSETAFVSARDEGGFDLRWFTPAAEVALCGHATLASAHVLWETGRVAPDEAARFFTRSGWLECRRVGDEVEMRFPARPVTEAEPPAGLLEALGVSATFVGRTADDFLVEVSTEHEVRSAEPDLREVKKVPVRGVIVTALGAQGASYDFVSRFFAPAVGVDEDPVTGSAHCALAPYWAAKLGRVVLLGRQASARGGDVGVRLEGEGSQVVLVGRAVTILRGQLDPAVTAVPFR